ncbi:polysaccharide deacetylase family protein [Paenibacillus ehimensis]|uniref:Polysaccharide deacetylase family protein n=1 Tax=Paenibacillus ehimensis TaxID=79264 RepID=A0ABT8VJD0_9BACL|nr:polysaccharide deacetylase family protein [Paenibacillus ehimensis]MDO3681097.1 polysaccharide deacetylase family protein [Paenibacillus ehimensis]MEC0212436.1 polysaccharide deacetylase family protein [Paenibacillus ehimensis]
MKKRTPAAFLLLSAHRFISLRIGKCLSLSGLSLCLALTACTPAANSPQAMPPGTGSTEATPQNTAKAAETDTGSPLSLVGPPAPLSVQQVPSPSAPPAPAPAPAPAVVPSAESKRQKQPKSKAHPAKPSKETSGQSQRLSLSQLVRKYPELLLLRGSAASGQVALTFDDAPDTTFTPQVLDVLKKHQVRATFFLVGAQAEKHPEMVKRIVREGHVIGNHSYSHKLFTKLSDDLFQSQVLQTQQALKRLIGYSPRLLRPPYGEISESQLLWASEHGYRIVNWNVDSLDWKQLGPEKVTSNILTNVKPGSIILQHSGGGPGQDLNGTVKALPTVIQTLKSRNLKIVTLPELLRVSKQLE